MIMLIAYDLGNLLRRLILPVSIQSWSLGAPHKMGRSFNATTAAGSISGIPVKRIISVG